jgi:hypothetical protein
MIALIHYSENATLVVPICLSFKTFNFFNNQPSEHLYQQASLLLSSITLPYRIKTDLSGFENFMQRMTPCPSCNIFNLTARIPFS